MRKAKAKSNTTKPITRQAVEAQIDLLIDLLNAIDPDPDAEPSLGWTQASGHWLETPDHLLANANGGDDREEEDEREPSEDGEPSLGWTTHDNQTSAAFHANHLGTVDMEEGVGAVRKKRPASKTGNNVYRGCEVLTVLAASSSA
jgi:hypothetical protein